jgi:cytochrome c peroxidase
MPRHLARAVVLLVMALLVFALVAAPAGAKRGKSNLSNQLIELGAELYFDADLSDPDGQACADCHDPMAGFADPAQDLPVSEGVILGKFGGRNAPSASYTAWSPLLYFDDAESLWIGGMFWDGRATGWTLGSPLAEQAQGPFLNPIEMNSASEAAVVAEIAASKYADLFLKVYPATDWATPEGIDQAYDDMAMAIAAYESSKWVNPFKSRFDAWVGGDEKALTQQEKDGWELFNGKGQCNLCHLSEPTMQSTGLARGKALFTDHTYDNLGIPANPEVWALTGIADVDLGLGGFLAGQPMFATMAADENGKFKVPSLRNVAMTAPYGHNGYFETLYDITHFYNTRDVDPMWPDPEYAATMNVGELGDLGLTFEEEMAIVAFMETLTDSPVLPQPAH